MRPSRAPGAVDHIPKSIPSALGHRTPGRSAKAPLTDAVICMILSKLSAK